MKKTINFFLILTLALTILTGCQGTTTATTAKIAATTEEVNIRIGGLKGPTSMGMVQLMESSAKGTASNKYGFIIAGSADEITPKLIQGDLDIAAVPANLAAVLYNNTKGAVKLLAINTLGVTYIVEKGNTVNSYEDLRGKTIYATGKGSIPEYTLRYLLSANGIDPDKDVKFEWKSEPTEVVSLLSEASGGVAMLPQPFVTVAQSKINGLRIAIDLNKSWKDLNNGSMMITGVLVVRSAFAEKYPEKLAAFLDEYKKSTEYVNANVKEAAKLVEKFNIVSAAVAEQAIPLCNIAYFEGTEMKTAAKGYLDVLYKQNPKSVGGVIPDEGFYYAR